MLALRNALDDPSQETCGKCENCIAEPVLTKVFDQEIGIRATQFLRHSEEIIKPRKQIAASNDEAARTFVEYEFPRNLGDLVAQEG
ncbi:ATP-dependent DNA helicase RecG, partial [Klebsiella pneumoniae]|nr:ATP-dependent DNA helicase RecG [Klebsiella pneumoniae]